MLLENNAKSLRIRWPDKIWAAWDLFMLKIVRCLSEIKISLYVICFYLLNLPILFKRNSRAEGQWAIGTSKVSQT